MNKIEIYTKSWCPYCARAKSLLQSRQLDYTEIDVTTDVLREREMIERSARSSVPQIFIDAEPIGGYDDLASISASGELDRRLGLAAAIDPNQLSADQRGYHRPQDGIS